MSTNVKATSSSQYLQSLRKLHKMCVKRTFSPDYQDYIDNLEQRFKVVREMKLISFTTKCHIILSHIGVYMTKTRMSLLHRQHEPPGEHPQRLQEQGH